jgi:hypothetical protein
MLASNNHRYTGRRVEKWKLVAAQPQQEVHDTNLTQEHQNLFKLDGNVVNMNTGQAPS